MNNPLNDIKKWFLGLDSNEQNNLGSLIDHLSPIIKDPFEKEQTYKFKFLYPLETEETDALAILQKALYFNKIIDFCINGWFTEQEMQARLDTLIETNDEYSKKGRPEIGEVMLNQFYEIRQSWDTLSTSWVNISNGVLSNSKIKEWYINELMKQLKRQ